MWMHHGALNKGGQQSASVLVTCKNDFKWVLARE